MMFRLTQTAVGLAGMGTAAALQIKEITLKYFEDKFAGWIVHQGGWVRHFFYWARILLLSLFSVICYIADFVSFLL